ncbi:MAG: hypothetical protein IH599_08590, partial [Bacteroidales bacterium]|nr:hypothetical protein [Bacteroidales bacterium]
MAHPGKSLFILVLVLSSTLYGQSRYLPGTVFFHSGDTMRGSIREPGEIRSAKICQFLPENGQEERKYGPEDIRGYKFDQGKYYVSREIERQGIKDAVFLEYLLDGVADLLAYTDEEGVHYFIQKSGGALHELTTSTQLIESEGREYLHTRRDYVGYLRYLFADAPSVQQEVDNTTLSRSSLIRITSEYHAQVCDTADCIIYKKQLAKPALSIGPLAGWGSFRLVEKDLNLSTGYYKYNYNAPEHPVFGLNAQLSLPYLNKRLKLAYTSRVFSYTLHSDRYVYRYDGKLMGIYPYTLENTDLMHSLLLSASLPGRKLSPVILLGGSYAHKLKYKKTGLDFCYGSTEPFPSKPTFGVEAG